MLESELLADKVPREDGLVTGVTIDLLLEPDKVIEELVTWGVP